MGFKFADAPGQTDYQYVGDELKKLMQAEVKSAVSDPAALKGKKVTVVGAISVIGAGTPVPKPKPVNIQPVEHQGGVVTSGAGSVATAPRGATATDDDVVLRGRRHQQDLRRDPGPQGRELRGPPRARSPCCSARTAPASRR